LREPYIQLTQGTRRRYRHGRRRQGMVKAAGVAAQDYNVAVRSFPGNPTAMLFGHKVKPTFTVENEQAIAKPRAVDFSKAEGFLQARAGAEQVTK
jgi:hypothetical protein